MCDVFVFFSDALVFGAVVCYVILRISVEFLMWSDVLLSHHRFYGVSSKVYGLAKTLPWRQPRSVVDEDNNSIGLEVC